MLEPGTDPARSLLPDLRRPASLLARHQRRAVEHGVARLDQPRVGADALHRTSNVEHQIELVVAADAGAAVVVTVLLQHFPDGSLMVVALNHRRVDDEVRVGEAGLTIGRGFERQIRAKISRILHGQSMDDVKPLCIDVHEADERALQALGETQIFDQSQ